MPENSIPSHNENRPTETFGSPGNGTVLSIVVVVVEGPESLARCLEALDLQVRPLAAEIIVPCDETLAGTEELRRRFPRVRFHRVEGRRTYAELRAAGVAESKGGIVALTEDHCLPRPGWCDGILDAHSRSDAAIGGPVEKQTPDTTVNWAIYLCDYLRYMPPVDAGPAENLTDCNVTYKLSALNPIRALWDREFHEPVVHGALRRRGESLCITPGIVVEQRRNMRLGAAVRDRYAFGRLFGATRLEGSGDRASWLYAAATPLLPPLLMARMAAQVFRKRRRIAEFLRALPALLVLSTAWALGEALGYLTGRAGASLTPLGDAADSCVEKEVSQAS